MPSYYAQLPTTAAQALTEYDQAMQAAFAARPLDGLEVLGQVNTSGAPRMEFPFIVDVPRPALEAGAYVYRKLGVLSVHVDPWPYQDGVDIDPAMVENPAWSGWGSAPVNMGVAFGKIAGNLIAAAINTNAATQWDGLSLFNNAHLRNPLNVADGTFDNNQAVGALSAATLGTAVALFNSQTTSGTDPLGIRAEILLVPPALEITAATILQAALVATGGTNVMQGMLRIVSDPRIASATSFYLLGGLSQGLYPWFVAQDPGIETRISDQSSQYYKDSGHIKVSAHRRVGMALGDPRCCWLMNP